MSEPFDPYHNWLGIQPKDQPPDHYRLLGIAPLEDAPNVIEASADRQTAHVWRYQSGEHGALSQKLLNRLAAAKLVLLDPAKKSEYDRKLQAPQAKIAHPAPRPTSRPMPVANPPPGTGTTEGPAPVAEGVSQAAMYRRRRKSAQQQWIAVTCGGVGVAVLVALVYAFRAGDESQVAETDADRNAATTVKSEPDPPADPVLLPVSPDATTDIAVPQPPLPDPPEDPAGPPAIDSNPEPPPNSSPPPDPDPNPLPDPDSPPSNPEPGEKRLPVPAEEVQQTMAQEIRSIFSREYTQAEQPAGKLPLAEMLLVRAKEAAEDPTARFVMLGEALRFSAEAGNVTTAGAAIKALAAAYQTDVWHLRRTASAQLGRTARTDEDRQAAVKAMFDLAALALEEEQFDAADQFAGVCLALAVKARDVEMRKQEDALVKRIRVAARLFEKYRPAFETLEQSPDDPDANLAAGEYLCFQKGDWPRGLRHLARGSDAALKALAEADRAKPRDPAEQIALGDRWWDVADSLIAAVQKSTVQSRSARWYRPAVAGLSGLARARVQKRLDEVDEAEAEAETATAGPRRDPVPGLIGRMYVDGVDAGLVLRCLAGAYARDNTVRPALTAHNVSGNKIQIEMLGVLKVTAQTTVLIRHRGGSSTRGVLTFSLDGCQFGVIGDDRIKDTTYNVPLAPGEHEIRWTIRGGSPGDNQITFSNPQLNGPLAVYCTPETVDRIQAAQYKAIVNTGGQ